MHSCRASKRAAYGNLLCNCLLPTRLSPVSHEPAGNGKLPSASLPCRARDMDAEEEYDNDGGLAMYESRKSSVSLAKQATRERANQVCS